VRSYKKSCNESCNETYDPNLQLKYPDRQPSAAPSSDESFVACSLDVPLTQLSQQSVSATPCSSVAESAIESDETQRVRRSIAELCEQLHGLKYETFVHKNMHLAFKIYPFDLEW
jgi:hypothetical protein